MRIKYNHLKDKNIADILLLTATKTETKALHSHLAPICEDGILEIEKDDTVYYAGVFGGYNIVHCQCNNMGTQEKGSSILKTTNALSDWSNIKAVVMIGIAFGMYENEGEKPQHYSDVIVASKVFPYENQRVNSDGKTKFRGQEHSASEKLADAFSVISRSWTRKNTFGEKTNIEISPILSGEKLVDNIEFRDRLKEEKPEYRGGEMEGIGVASSCESAKKPWILLKGICDFADGNKGEDKHTKQKDAAQAAVEACELAFSTTNVANLIGDKVNYTYRPFELDLNKVFFIHYSDDCEPFYLERDVDKEVQPYVLATTCWVYGKSGIGKSELLTRILHINNVNYVDFNLSICDKTNVIESFEEIQNVLCQKFDVNYTQCSDFKSIVKEICKVLNNKYQGENLYLLIDEIPFDFRSVQFKEFADKFCSMMNYLSKELKNTHIYFMLSSIADPTLSFEKDELLKIKQIIKFIKMKEWTLEQAVALITLLNDYVELDWTKFDMSDFANQSNFSP